MQNFPDNDFDAMIKKSLEEPKIDFDPQAWKQMEKKLDLISLPWWSILIHNFSIITGSIIILYLMLFNFDYGFSNKNSILNGKSFEEMIITLEKVKTSSQLNENKESKNHEENNGVESITSINKNTDIQSNSINNNFIQNQETEENNNNLLKDEALDHKGQNDNPTENIVKNEKNENLNNIPSKVNNNIQEQKTEENNKILKKEALETKDQDIYNSKIIIQNEENENVKSYSQQGDNSPNLKIEGDKNNIIKKEALQQEDLNLNHSKFIVKKAENENQFTHLLLPRIILKSYVFEKNEYFPVERPIGPIDILKVNSQLPDNELKSDAELTQQPKLNVNFFLSPDISTVNFSNAKGTGLNVGAAVEFYLSSRWRISTGIMRSSKIYSVNSKKNNNYWQPPQQTRIESIDATCFVLDIPLNIRYNLSISEKSSFFISSGLSTYLMLKEDYEYKYNNSTTTWSDNISINGENQHFFQIINFSMGYEKDLSKRLSFQGEPFLKIPFKDVGYGGVRLITVGAFLSVKYKLY